LAFALDQVPAVVAAKPELRTQEPYRTVLSGDMSAIGKLSEKDLLAIMAATHAGMTPEAFDASVKAWLTKARDPRFKRPYTSLVYQPQLELLRYLRANGYKTYIVSGGGVDFMRAFAGPVYGVPPEQVIGSSAKGKFVQQDGRWVLIKTVEDVNVDDKEGKPANIALHVGRRPVIAVGNSDGDLPMLQYAAAGTGPSLEIFIHHDDVAREYAYDRTDPLQKFDKGWDEAGAKGWVVISIKSDWKTVYPPAP
jgi:phosphoserine phosphatase